MFQWVTPVISNVSNLAHFLFTSLWISKASPISHEIQPAYDIYSDNGDNGDFEYSSLYMISVPVLYISLVCFVFFIRPNWFFKKEVNDNESFVIFDITKKMMNPYAQDIEKITMMDGHNLSTVSKKPYDMSYPDNILSIDNTLENFIESRLVGGRKIIFFTYDEGGHQWTAFQNTFPNVMSKYKTQIKFIDLRHIIMATSGKSDIVPKHVFTRSYNCYDSYSCVQMFKKVLFKNLQRLRANIPCAQNDRDALSLFLVHQ